MAFDGLTDLLVVFGVDVAAVVDGDGTVPFEVGVGTDVPAVDLADGRVLFMFWEPPTTLTQPSTWPAHAPQQRTTGQESAPMLTNNGKRYKRKHSHATALQTANTPARNAKNPRYHSS